MSIRKGFSLIEVLIFVTILSVFLIISLAVITVSMRQNTIKINMLKATHYNEQLLSWIRTEKETEWKVFTDNAANRTICFTALQWSGGVVDKNSCAYDLSGMYRRYAVFTTTLQGGSPTQVDVVVHAEWQDGGNNYSTQLQSLFTIWE